eukprot:m.338609 g.338609  ORF g.338609 m.338609 type:complete len:409 (+) comp18479_c0_seq1:145-1371(+)
MGEAAEAVSMEAPFHDEASFKAWNGEASKHKHPPKTVYPKDRDDATEEEKELTEKVRGEVKPELKDLMTEDMLTRFVRGYAMRSWAGAPDRVERTGIILNLALDWRKRIGADTFAEKELPKRDEWDRLWPQTLPGQDNVGRVIMYSVWPADMQNKFTMEEAHNLHIQDMIRLEKAKAKANEKLKAEGKKGNHHHTLVLDLGHDNSELSRAMLKYMKEVTMDPRGFSITQYFFPDVLEKGIVINAPFLFRALWAFGKLFMEADTAQKYSISGGDYKHALDEAGIPLSAISMCSGGTAPNPQGMPTKLAVTRELQEKKLVVSSGCTKVSWKVTCNKTSDPDFSISIYIKKKSDGTEQEIKTEVVQGSNQEGVKGSVDTAEGDEIIFKYKSESRKSHGNLLVDVEEPPMWS